MVAGESDLGSGLIFSLSTPPAGNSHEAMVAFRAALPPLKVVVLAAPPRSGGSDIAGLMSLKVPFVDFNQDASRYFDLHHSADDTLDKIDPAELTQNVAVWSAFIHVVANSDIDFRSKERPPAWLRPRAAVSGGSTLVSTAGDTLSRRTEPRHAHPIRQVATMLARGFAGWATASVAARRLTVRLWPCRCPWAPPCASECTFPTADLRANRRVPVSALGVNCSADRPCAGGFIVLVAATVAVRARWLIHDGHRSPG